MSGLCGWLGTCAQASAPVLDAMSKPLTQSDNVSRHRATGAGFGLAVAGPAGAIGHHASDDVTVMFHGHPQWLHANRSARSAAEFAAEVAQAYRESDTAFVAKLGGDFAVALIDIPRRRLCIAVDRSGVRNLIYRRAREAFVFGATLDSVAAFPDARAIVDPQAIYNYVYFHMVPGPGTALAGFERLLGGTQLEVEADATPVVRRYWRMSFEEPGSAASPALAGRFRESLRHGVEAFAPPANEGAFLSGGTDSSTVAWLLTETMGRPVATYSIGFHADDYDEMAYARIAARRFATDHHEYYVTREDVVEVVPVVAAAFDQPFGNASAVPTYLCASMARRHGADRMLAGDGGDELFGGNARYAKQAQLAHYSRLPQWLRAGLIEPLLAPAFLARLPLLGKARSYSHQARLPMPARYETYNLLERLGPRNVFSAEFLATVDTRRPLDLLGEEYRSNRAGSLVNQLLRIDLRFTLADSDLPKVTRMCDRAGVDVAFPMLHDDVVAFSAVLAPRLKLRGSRLRPFFKDSLRGILPDETLAKRKHGFGLPSGLWLADHAPLNAMARDAVASLSMRGIFRPAFLAELTGARLREHAGYYGTMLWVLMMLELWFQHHVDKSTAR